ncbi:MAG: MotA/TolQ/ExbB proton channel family protein [Sulfurimonas sp.]|nr:MotA/TolQ/ExbB proton channel family protein [Sulfurimonas sp.]
MNKKSFEEFFQLKKEGKALDCIDNLLKIMSVPTLLAFIVLIAYMGFIPLQMELHSILIIGVIYVVFGFFVKHNACYSTCTFHNTKRALILEVSKYIEENLTLLMGEKKAIGSVDKFFDRFSQKLRNDNYAAVAAGTFPTLGILGTFISIALSMPDFSAGSADALNHEITKLLGGVGTAFYASIYGIFLSLWWVFFEKKGFSFIERELQEIKEVFEKKLWSEEELKRATFVEQQLLNRGLQETIKQSLSPDFIQKLNDTINVQTGLLYKTLKADRVFHEELRKTYKSVVEKFSIITEKQEAIGEKLDLSITAANQSYTNLSDNVDKLQSLSQLFQSNYDAMTSQNESSKEVAEILDKVISSFSMQTENITQTLEITTNNFRSSQSSIDGVSERLLNVSEAMDDLVDRLVISTDKQITVSEKLDKSITVANTSYETLSHNVAELESLSKVFKNSQKLIVSQNESSTKVADILATSLTELNSQTHEISGFFSGFSTNLAEAKTSIGSMSDKLLDLSNGMLKLLDGLDDVYSETTKKQMKGVNKSIASLEMLYSRFQDNIENTLQSFEQNSMNIKNGNERMIDSVKSFEESLEDSNIELLEKLDILIHATSKAKEIK